MVLIGQLLAQAAAFLCLIREAQKPERQRLEHPRQDSRVVAQCPDQPEVILCSVQGKGGLEMPAGRLEFSLEEFQLAHKAVGMQQLVAVARKFGGAKTLLAVQLALFDIPAHLVEGAETQMG